MELPAGRHYTLLGGIPDQPGGMSLTVLQRSRAFVERAGAEVTILTTKHRNDYRDVRRRLRDNGSMIDGMHLRNLWEDVQQWDDDHLRSLAFDQPAPVGIDAAERRDFFRADGSMLAARLGRGNGAPLVLCDRRGEPLGAWRSMSGVLSAWLDTLPRDPVAWMIVDARLIAPLVADYHRPDVVKLHVVHGSHLRRGGDPMREKVVGRKATLENLDAWDSVVFLTQRQRADVKARFADAAGNLAVIPNSCNVPAVQSKTWRRRGRGVMLASLDARKRVPYAIRAIGRVSGRLGRRKVRLDVWGRGPLAAELEELISAKGAPVRLRGYSPKAVREFSKSSFSLLTSRSEGFGNVLVESMGRGCIPISFDVPYGPDEIITDGVDGFLVRSGDSRGLAERIEWVVAAKRSQLAPMRAAGRARAMDFGDGQVTRLWAEHFAEIAHRRGFK